MPPAEIEGVGGRTVTNHLADLQTSAAYLALKGSAAVRLTAVQGRDELVTKAKTDFGAFLAVKHLLPVAIEGAVGTLSAVHSDLYAEWQADAALTPEQRQQGLADHSDDRLEGGEGTDQLIGGGGNDTLYGGADDLFGGEGDDLRMGRLITSAANDKDWRVVA
nr:hypothetical protein [Azonexus sp.]